MRWPRPRFTVRRLMIGMAILAIGFGAISWVARMRARSAVYAQRAQEFVGKMLLVGSFAGGWNRYENENVRLKDEWA